MDKVCEYLQILEKDYFSLIYRDRYETKVRYLIYYFIKVIFFISPISIYILGLGQFGLVLYWLKLH